MTKATSTKVQYKKKTTSKRWFDGIYPQSCTMIEKTMVMHHREEISDLRLHWKH